MKKTLALILALLLSAAALAEYIGGEGWWDDDYDGTVYYCPDGDLYFWLPDDWGDNFGEEGEMLFCRNDYGITLRVCSHPGTIWDMSEAIEADGLFWDGFQYEESANIILKDDRDWYIIANEYSMCAFTDDAYGNTIEFCFGFEEDDYNRMVVRRIISSVESD